MFWSGYSAFIMYAASSLLLASVAGCASSAVNEGVNTATAKVDPNSVGLSVQYSLNEQKFKLKPFYSPSAQVPTKANLISPTKTVTPSSFADPVSPLDKVESGEMNQQQAIPALDVEEPQTNNTP